MKRDLVLSLCIILLFGAAVAPTLTFQEFSNSSENLVVGTAQELRRGAPWLAPTLHGELRWQKPPVTTWIIASSIRPQTMQDISSTDRGTRHAALIDLAKEVRWPALAASCLTLLGVYALANVLGGSRLALLSTVVAASSYFLLRFCRLATTDIFLTLWVTWINVLLAVALLKRTTWSNCIGAGLLLGLAVMTKGPVPLLQTIVPFAAYLFWRRYALRRDDEPLATLRRPPLVAGLIAMLLVGAPWWIYVVTQVPNSLNRLQAEMTGIGVIDAPDPWWSYFFIIGYALPYTGFLIVAMIQFCIDVVRRRSGPLVLSGFLCFVPMILMMFFRERHDRYLLPMLGPMAILIGFVLREHLDHWRKWNIGDRLIVAIHWLGIATMIVLFLLGASLGRPPWMTRLDNGQPMFSQKFAMTLLTIGFLLIAIGALAYLRWRGALVTFTLIICLVSQYVVMLGYPISEAGSSDMWPLADAILDRYPDAVAYNAHPLPKRPPSDLAVYLNREALWIRDPSALRAGDRPLVLFMLQNNGQPAPQPPPGWVWIAKAPKRKDWWHAFVLPAAR